MIISEVATDTSATRHMAVYDVMGTLRSTLLHDGSVVDPRGELIAYIEADGTVGDVNLAYVGEVTAPNGSSLGFVTDANDDMIAQVDYGLATIKDARGSTIAAINRAGEVSGHTGARCATLDGFNFNAIREAAAYLVLVDQALLHGK